MIGNIPRKLTKNCCSRRANHKIHGAARIGFTLIELVLVLMILAILAGAAISMVDVQVDQTRFDTTQRTVESVDNAILEHRLESNGTRTRSGFFVDIGGLPRPDADTADLNGDGVVDENILTLRELWVFPTMANEFDRTLAPFDLRAATNAFGTVVVNTDTDAVDGENDYDLQQVFQDSEVIVGSGWRGPYLRLPTAAAELRDGWGHRLVSYPDRADPVLPSDEEFYDHLRKEDQPDPPDGFDDSVNLPSEGVIGVRSLGNTDTLGGVTYELDVPSITNHVALRDAHLWAQVQGTVFVSVDLTSPPLIEPSDSTEEEELEDRVLVQLFYPDSDTGLVRIERASIVYDRYDDNGTPDDSDPGNGDETLDDKLIFTFDFKDTRVVAAPGVPVEFPIGTRPIRGYFDIDDDGFDSDEDQNVDPNEEGEAPITAMSAIHRLSLTPNINNPPDLILD